MAFDIKRLFSLKNIAIALGGVVTLVIIGAIAFIAFFPKDWAIAQVTQRIEAATGRELAIAGDVDIAFWPALGFSAEHVTLSNPEGFSDEPFLATDRIVFAVKVMPLLRGAIEVKELILEGADLRLAAKEDGQANWIFPTEESATQQTTLEDLKLDDLRLTDSRLTFTGPNPATPPLTLENIDGSMAIDSLDAPAHVTAHFDYREQQINLEADIGLPRAMLERGSTPLTAQVRSDPLDADFEGQFASETGALTGKIKADGSSMRDVMAWTGTPMAPGDGFAAFSVESNFAHEGEAYAFTSGTFKLDAITATGAVTVTMPAMGRMRADGALSTALLDLNPYLPAPPAGAGEGGVEVSTAWDQAPIDLSGLRAMDADLNLTIAQLKFQRMTFSDARMALHIANGVADARLSHIALYGGAGTARLIADGARATPRIAVDLNVDNVQALPLLTDAIGFEKIEGRGRLRASLGGQGASQAALMRSLSGTASFNFNDGAWRGVNLAQIARTVQTLASGAQPTAASSAATDFAELSASFRFTQGVAATEDLKLLNPLVRLDGAGLIDVGGQSIDMRLSPRAVNSLEGQGGQADLQGLGVPFRVSGPWARPSFRPDLGDAMRQQLRDRLRVAAGQEAADSPLGMLSTAIFGAPTTTPAATPAPAAETTTPPAGETTTAETPAPREQTQEERMRDALGGLFKTK
jgi:AsmA protein